MKSLAKLHDQGVVHGDLHAGNMIVKDDGRVMLLDLAGSQMDKEGRAIEDERDYVAMIVSG